MRAAPVMVCRILVLLYRVAIVSHVSSFQERRQLFSRGPDPNNDDDGTTKRSVCYDDDDENHAETSCRRRLGFAVIALGNYGGIDQSFGTSFLVKGIGGSCASIATEGFVGLDGGSTVSGIRAAVARRSFDGLLPTTDDREHYSFAATGDRGGDLTETGYVFREGVKAYLLTHPHQDHNIGLIISSTEDVVGGLKPVYGTNFTLQALQDEIWTWRAWPNFGNRGQSPLNTYSLQTIEADERTRHSIASGSTGISFTAFPLAHGTYPTDESSSSSGVPSWVPYPSTAYLLEYRPSDGSGTACEPSRLLFFGDTGADSINRSGRMRRVWEAVAPYVVDGSLRAILLECAFANDVPDQNLFGHLKPELFVQELAVLRDTVQRSLHVGDANELIGRIKIIVEHIKPESLLYQRTMASEDQVMQEIEKCSKIFRLNLTLSHPTPGERIDTL